MSTYTYRYIEVLAEQIDGAVWSKKDLPSAKEHEGEIFKINEYNRPTDVAPYYKAVEKPGITFDESVYVWVPLEKVEKKWVPVKWYSILNKNRVLLNKDPYWKPKYFTYSCGINQILFEEHICWSNNGGCVRDDYISSRGWKESKVSGRGLPSDVSEEVKNDVVSDYHYDMTWVTISEWEEIFETRKKEFETEVYKRYAKEDKREVMAKLDDIFKAIKDPNYTPKKKKKSDDDYLEWEESIEYLFEEDIWGLFTLRMEITRAEFILEEFADSYSYSQSRIIYYLA